MATQHDLHGAIFRTQTDSQVKNPAGWRILTWEKVQAKVGQPLPVKIVRQKEWIAELTRRAELFLRIYKHIDMSQVHTIVEAKMHLDYLYGAWVEDEL